MWRHPPTCLVARVSRTNKAPIPGINDRVDEGLDADRGYASVRRKGRCHTKFPAKALAST